MFDFDVASKSKPRSARDRVTVFPVALGALRASGSLHVSENNAGNGVEGHAIGRAHGTIQGAHRNTYIHPYSALVNARVGLLVKMDAQGFECAILRGMGHAIDQIQVIKTEIANMWRLSGQANCSDATLFGLLHDAGKELKDERGTTLTEPYRNREYDLIATRSVKPTHAKTSNPKGLERALPRASSRRM